jgi:hypothetical protein
MIRGLVGAVWYFVDEFVVSPLLDKIVGFDFEAYKDAKRAEFYHLHEYD